MVCEQSGRFQYSVPLQFKLIKNTSNYIFHFQLRHYPRCHFFQSREGLPYEVLWSQISCSFFMFDFYNNKSNLVLQKVFKMLTKLNYINYDINLKINIISYHNLEGSKWTVPKICQSQCRTRSILDLQMSWSRCTSSPRLQLNISTSTGKLKKT